VPHIIDYDDDHDNDNDNDKEKILFICEYFASSRI